MKWHCSPRALLSPVRPRLRRIFSRFTLLVNPRFPPTEKVVFLFLFLFLIRFLRFSRKLRRFRPPLLAPPQAGVCLRAAGCTCIFLVHIQRKKRRKYFLTLSCPTCTFFRFKAHGFYLLLLYPVSCRNFLLVFQRLKFSHLRSLLSANLEASIA